MEEEYVKPLFTEEEFFDPVATRQRLISRQIKDKRNKYCKNNMDRILKLYNKVKSDQRKYIISHGRRGNKKLLNAYLTPEDRMCLEQYHLQKSKKTSRHNFELTDDDYKAKTVPLSPLVKKLKKQIKKHGPDNKESLFDKSFRKISKKPGACGANRKKRTKRRKKTKNKKKKKKKRTYKNNTAGSVTVDLQKIQKMYDRNPEDVYFQIENWEIAEDFNTPILVQTDNVILTGISENRAKFILLSRNGDLTDEIIEMYSDDFGDQADIYDGIINAFPLKIVKVGHRGGKRKGKNKSRKKKTKNRKKKSKKI